MVRSFWGFPIKEAPTFVGSSEQLEPEPQGRFTSFSGTNTLNRQDLQNLGVKGKPDFEAACEKPADSVQFRFQLGFQEVLGSWMRA